MLIGSDMKNSVICLAIFLASSTVAVAQEVNTPACGRSGSRIVMAGVDMDVQRCKEAVARQARIQTEDLLIKAQAELMMTKADLETAGRRQAELEKMCTDVPDCAKVLHPDNPAPQPPPSQAPAAPSAPPGPPAPE